MIRIGINKGVFLASTTINEKNVLEIGFDQKRDQEIKNPFEQLAADDVVQNTNVSVNIFTPLQPKDDKGYTQEKKVEMMVRRFNEIKGVLQHLMSGYMTKEEYTIGMRMYDGTGIDADNFATKILVKETSDLVALNMFRFFISAMKPYVGKKDQLFRLLLVRQSKDKAFATFRTNYIEENPFWESMDVPEEASKVKFTKYELKEGLDDDTPVSKSDADPKGAAGSTNVAPPAEALTVNNVFGGQ